MRKSTFQGRDHGPRLFGLHRGRRAQGHRKCAGGAGSPRSAGGHGAVRGRVTARTRAHTQTQTHVVTRLARTTHVQNHVVDEVAERHADEVVKRVQDHAVDVDDVVLPGLAGRDRSEQLRVFLPADPAVGGRRTARRSPPRAVPARTRGAPCLRPRSRHTVLLTSCVFTSKPTKTQAGFHGHRGRPPARTRRGQGPRQRPQTPGARPAGPCAPALRSPLSVLAPAGRAHASSEPHPQAGPPPREVTRASRHACLQHEPWETSFGDLVGGRPCPHPLRAGTGSGLTLGAQEGDTE